MRIVIFPKKESIVPFHLIRGLLERGIDLRWVGDDSLWPPYLLPIPPEVSDSSIPAREAGLLLRKEPIDYLVFSEGSNYLPYLSTSRAPRIVLDTLDPPTINLTDLCMSHIYFKCQLPQNKEEWILSDSRGGFANYGSFVEATAGLFDLSCHEGKIQPFPYSVFNLTRRFPMPSPTRGVFFLGWDSGQVSNRREVVARLKSANEEGCLDFSGGLFKRDELWGEEPPEHLVHPRISPLELYYNTCRDFKVNIAPAGNGSLTFRLYELLALGCFVLAERIPVRILPEEPVDGQHLVYFDPDLSNLVDLCRYYIENDEERASIAKRGYDFYWNRLTHCHIADHFLSRLKELSDATV